MAKFMISGFSDEIDANIDKQFEHLGKLGMKYFEPRGIDGKNVIDLTDDELKALKEKMDKLGIKASSIGSPIGKIRISEDFEPHMELLKKAIKVAKFLETKYIRIFSFFISDKNYDEHRAEVMRRMKAMVELAEKEGVILLHENEKGIYGDIASRCADILEEVNSSALGCVFDPANFIQSQQPTYPEAYDILKKHITYMHIKDALPNGDVVPAGYGEGHVKEILTDLHKNGYDGFLSIEPHLGKFTGVEALELDDKMLALTASTPDKFTLAYRALTDITDSI